MLKKNTQGIVSDCNQQIDFSDTDFFKLFKIVLPNFPASIYVKDKNGRYIWCNAYQLNMAGLSNLKDIQGKTDYDLPWRKSADHITSIDKKVLRSKQLLVTEEHAQLFHGREATFLTKKIPWFKDDNTQEPTGIAGISMDISDRRHMENESKIQFIKNIQHSVHVPTLGLLHTLSILVEKEKDPLKKEVAQLALGSAKELMNLLNSILNFDQAQYNPPILDKPFKLLDVFQSVYRIHWAAAHAKNLKFNYKISSNIPSIVLCDEFRIKHILLNLVSNAIKFTNQGNIFFEAKLISTKDRDLLIEFIIKDTGISIPKEKQNIIFEKFVCLDPSRKDIFKGIGFGLTNVKGYIQELEGEFKPIQSEKGKGTTFSFLIPMKASFDQNMVLDSFTQTKNKTKIESPNNDSTKLTATEKPKKTPKANPQKKVTASSSIEIRVKVLVVEDSPLAQRITELVLLDLNCEVDVANTAEEALKMLKENTYDIIFLDVGLPGMSGIDMIKQLRQDEKKKNSLPIPVIGQSAQVNIKNKKFCLDAGMQDLLPKPLVARTIAELLNNYVAHYVKACPAQKTPAERPIHNAHVIDKILFDKITNSDPETRTLFMTLTKQLLKTDVIDFKKAHEEKDWRKLLFLTHKLRGSFACIAAMRLEEAFAHLEEYLCESKISNAENIQALYDTILTEIEMFKKEID